MIVVIRPTPGGSWQGVYVGQGEELPKAIWAGSGKKVKDAFIRESSGAHIQFINLTDGWDEI